MDVREAILQAGAALLREQGVAALTQPRVARAAGVKQSHLTYYFPRRTDLLLAIARHAIAAVMANLSGEQSGRSPSAALAETLTAAAIDGVPPRVLLGLVVAADTDPAIRAPLRELIGGVRGRFRSILAESGVAASAEAATLLHATVVGLAVLHDARRTPASAREVRQGIAAILRLLGAENGARGNGALQ